jgi:hypothetical protein
MLGEFIPCEEDVPAVVFDISGLIEEIMLGRNKRVLHNFDKGYARCG